MGNGQFGRSCVHATLLPAMTVSPSITVFSVFKCRFCFTAPAQMLGLAIFITAPALSHVTLVVVCPSLFNNLHFPSFLNDPFFLFVLTILCSGRDVAE